MDNHGFIKVAVASPKLKVANPEYNMLEIAKLMKEADGNETAVITFPELSITGYTCGDLFLHSLLINKSARALQSLLDLTKDSYILALVGMPLRIEDKLYNCGVAIQRGKVLGVVPKMHLPNYKEYYEKRWFSSGQNICGKIGEVEIFPGEKVPFGNLIFQSKEPAFSLGIEMCEDLWAPIPPSSYLVLNGANIITNLSASNEVVGKSTYRRELVTQQSARGICAYLYASAGVHESTTDLVYSGDCLICENGVILQKAKRFLRENEILYADIDLDRLAYDRHVNKTFSDSIDNLNTCEDYVKYKFVQVKYEKKYVLDKKSFNRRVDRLPFVPDNPVVVADRCEEIFNIQVAGLARRLEQIGCKHVVIGISGGLDSTLALLVAKKTFDLLNLPSEDIMACTMPGFGTSDNTLENALALMESLGVTIREIDIRQSCLQHFKDIAHDANILDITYENVQARERTQILMDIANKIGGIVVGTGDLSELSLGWCTYNGDHMSMYAVNSGIPKTLVKFLVRWVAENMFGSSCKETLYKIIDTPISPELLPPDKTGKIQQKTEDLIGPYELHDFFLFYTLRYGMEPQKIYFLAEKAFYEIYPKDEIKKWLKVFYKRFFSQQFKRSCMPDGPKVGSVNLSPRGDWRMPSDADVALWLKSLEESDI